MDDFESFHALPSYDKFAIAARAAVEAPNDPEDTVLVALTTQEVQIFALGSLLLGLIIPELSARVNDMHAKMVELGDAQGFYESREDSDATE